MNPQPKLVEEQSAESDFIDDIAELLPAEQRPLWYRDMAHLRRLPADDEMLRIARAMGFLALVTRQTPGTDRHGAGKACHDLGRQHQGHSVRPTRCSRSASATRRTAGAIASRNLRGHQSRSYCRETQRESAPTVCGKWHSRNSTSPSRHLETNEASRGRV